ncbi:MAG: sialidase family protein, partial [Dehalococcoidia bacterium]
MRECTPAKRSVPSLAMLLIGVLSAGLVGQVVVQTDGAQAPTGESPAGEGDGRSITTRPATSQPGETGPGPKPPWMPEGAGPWDAALCVVRSKDGLTFKPAQKPVIRFADAPTLARLKDGRLMAVFEHYPRTDRRLFGTLASAQSTDNGKTWSKPHPLKIKGLPRRAGPPGGPVLSVGPDQRWWLTFVCRDRKNRRTVLVARSKDGEEFKLAGRLDLVEEDLSIDDPAVLYIDKMGHLYGTTIGVAGQRYHGTSEIGRRFERQ